TFINKGIPGKVDYVSAPQYIRNFPPLHDWVILADYNCDGLPDIFTSGPFDKISLYKNTSTLAGGVSFQLITPAVPSDYGSSGSLGIYVSPADIPVITDIDGDGDLDIVTYSIQGWMAEYHKNMSRELYGNCDSLSYVMQHYCWGLFYDGNNCSNYLTLGDTCVPAINPIGWDSLAGNTKHSGTCLLCPERRDNKDRDLIIGHVLCTNLTHLENQGTNVNARMNNPDYTYPAYDIPVNMNVFACGFLADVDNDGKKDMLVSPNYNQQGAAEDFNSILWYQNVGNTDTMVLHYRQSNLLQDKMIDVGEGSFPVLHDYDGDGLADLFVGNYGYYDTSGIIRTRIALFRNTGTVIKPVFSLVTRDFANISSLNLGLTEFAPTFGDIDGDGDQDMIIGDYSGHVFYFEKQAGPADNFVYQPNVFSSVHVGAYATPQLFDLDGDGLLDLLIGNRNGNIAWYRNTGTTTSPVFSSATTTHLGGINTTLSGYTTGFAAPFFYREAGVTTLLVGTESGAIQKYGNIDGNLGGTFTLLDPHLAWIVEGERATPYLYDINGDGMPDLFVGNFAGGVEAYLGSSLTGINNLPNLPPFDFSLYPNPASTELNLDITGFRFGTTYKLEIIDLPGRLVYSSNLKDPENRIPVNGLSEGIYICRIRSVEGVVTSKLVIRK
ncbi:MAG TPA: T9SS type A sorting domain-containing protein, partial [Bacteroidia bacterium]|nr:T9SS type A sorting domain-containing protein [Bacteroidia bacterium]